MKKNSKKLLGNLGEQLTCSYLEQQGYTICSQNYSNFSGEIDIIAKKDDALCFIEVKTRSNPLFDMSELISYPKQRRIINTAKQYCAIQNIVDKTIRFDVALVTGPSAQELEVTVIENAFTES